MPTSNTSLSANGFTSPLLLPIVLLALFVLPISISGAAIALPAISTDLGNNPGPLQWVVNGFNASFALFTLIWGAAAARLGYKRTFLIGTLIMMAGSVLSVLATDLITLDVGRVLSGIGAAAIATGGTALLSSSFSGQQRARAFALLGTTVGLGLAAGPTISGIVAEVVGWRGVFAMVGIIAAVAYVSGIRLQVNQIAAPHSKAKLIDFSPLRNRLFLAIVLVPVAGSIAYVSILTYLPVALSAVLKMNAAQAGFFMLPLTLPVLVAPLVANLLTQKVRWISSLVIINTSLTLLIVGDLGLLLLGRDIPVLFLSVSMATLGFGWGLPLGLIDGDALAAVPEEMSGEAAGVLNFLRLGSEALSVAAYGAIMGTLLVNKISDPDTAYRIAAGWSGDPAAYSSSFHILLIAMAIITFLVTVLINVLHRSSRSASAVGTVTPQLGD
ncbi:MULTISPECIES: MFS transporter [Rhizobium/Agrobacterium group]|uniref:Major facilitator superfamily transporter MFS_1 n=1 Tax=Agrobacterium tumefaciens str. Kerr 14 TaxID=1183424 RepID=A0A1S7SDD0_AGRTU|nr:MULTISPECIES: MFS transporter [Rhizobium/Agrobacterium group]NTF97799.1 MFS transporter [Rhizobium rhizogenes]CUX67064.1 Major facilitator superfamily transporter MFS_1 [Agrobacterium tumefaciens str. Kerr 14]